MTDAELKALLREIALRPLTDGEAEAAYDAAEPVPLSEERIKEIVAYATGKGP